jgi:hypothetical protein
MRKTTQFLSLDGQVHDTPEKAEDYALNQAHNHLDGAVEESWEWTSRRTRLPNVCTDLARTAKHRSTNTLGNALNWVNDAYIPEDIHERDDDV